VFVGGCTLESALAVLGPSASVDALDSLLSKSLLRQVDSGATARLMMLETIREYAWEQLAHAAELEAARRAHAAYCLSLAEQAEPLLTGPDQKAWRQRLELEQDNLRAALRWAIEQHAGEEAQRLAGALRPFWFARGYWSEGRRWLEEALSIHPSSPVAEAVRAKALYGAGMLARFQGDFARARLLCGQSLDLYRTLADPSGTVMALVQLVRITTFQDDKPAMQTFLAEAAALVEALPDTAVKADAYTDMVIAQTSAGAYPPEAPQYLAESERIQRALNNPAGLAFVFAHQANIAVWDRDYARAASRFDEAERLAVELGDIRLLSRIAMSRVQLDILEGHVVAARQRLDMLQSAVTRGDHHVPAGLPLLAIILHKQGLHAWSTRLLGLAEAMTQRGQRNAEAVAFARFLRLDDTRADLRAQLGEEAFAREFAAGQRLTLADLPAIPHPPEPAASQARNTATPPAVPGAALTAREIEVLRLLNQDLSNPQIAARLVVSRRTVDAHLRSIYDKLNVRSRDGAVRAAQALGVLPGEG
jgi:ATP/maltotriose-dependent transcriptional regulator MalT